VLLPISPEPFVVPTDRDILPSERRLFVRTHRTDSDLFRATRREQNGTLGNDSEHLIHSMTSAFPGSASSAERPKRASQAENAGSNPSAPSRRPSELHRASQSLTSPAFAGFRSRFARHVFVLLGGLLCD
jgi:hypothetical protein